MALSAKPEDFEGLQVVGVMPVDSSGFAAMLTVFWFDDLACLDGFTDSFLRLDFFFILGVVASDLSRKLLWIFFPPLGDTCAHGFSVIFDPLRVVLLQVILFTFGPLLALLAAFF